MFLLGLTVFMVGWAVRGFIAAHQVADARQQMAVAEALTQLFKDQLEFLMQTVADAAPNRSSLSDLSLNSRSVKQSFYASRGTRKGVRRLGAVLRKEIFDIYAAMPSSWNTPRMAARSAS